MSLRVSMRELQSNQVMRNYFAVIVFSVVAAQAQTNRLTLTPKFFNELAEEARTNHPGMRAADARIRAAEQGARSVRYWDDPMIMAGGMVGNGVMRREEGDLLWGVEEKLPITGKPQAERALAQAETEVSEAEKEWRFQTLRRDIVQTAIRVALADEILRVSGLDQGWVETMVAATQARYAAGRSTQVEVLRMETEHAGRAEQLVVAGKEREAQALMLNRLLNRSLTTVWPEMELPKLAPAIEASERLLGMATRSEPKLRMLRQEIARAQSASEVARRGRRPDFSVGLEGRQFAGDGQFKEGSVVMKMTIPWLNKSKYDAAFRREKERAEAATWDAAEYEAQLRDEMSRLVIRIENARREAVLYREQIIPRSEQALNSAESSWQSGKSFFHDVLEARRLLLEGRTKYARAVAEQYLALAEVVICCGLADMEAVELFQHTNPEAK